MSRIDEEVELRKQFKEAHVKWEKLNNPADHGSSEFKEAWEKRLYVLGELSKLNCSKPIFKYRFYKNKVIKFTKKLIRL